MKSLKKNISDNRVEKITDKNTIKMSTLDMQLKVN